MKSLSLLLILAMIWAVGLLAFAARVDRSTPAADPPKADGIVALTGVSTDRIKAAMTLLENGKAERMLISGVNREATRSDVKSAAKVANPLYDCCVDLGFQAVDTVGNARETAEWVRAHEFDSLIVVTADYHMPRALLEIHAAAPDVALTAYPVATDEVDARAWWRTNQGARRMIIEYSKYLVILCRESFARLGPRDRPAASADAGTPDPSDSPPSAKPAHSHRTPH